MRLIGVDLATVTPLYMAGATQEPELRPPSFRGALRFWWRALWGSTHGDDWPRMAKDEASIFGDTQRASCVILRLDGRGTQESEEVDTEGKEGLQYLLWAFGVEGEQKGRAAFLADHTTFRLSLARRPAGDLHGDSTAPLLQAAAALWLLVNFGGVGTRARRGFGSLRPLHAPRGWPEILPPLTNSAETPEQLATYLSQGISEARSALGWDLVTVSQEPAFNLLHPTACTVVVWDRTWDSWQAALNAIGGELKRSRSRTSPDNTGVLAVIEGEPPPKTVTRAAFGLPLPFYYPHIKRGATVVPDGDRVNRRASPLLFKVAPLGNGLVTVVMTFFRARFVPSAKLQIQPKGGTPVIVDEPGYSAVDAFVSNLATLPVKL
ncbi:MAG: type III-B CRISPR module RAMP protein Cmr1 [Anaerolineae bacterium]